MNKDSYLEPTSVDISVDAINLRGAKVALVHDWLTGMRGGEKVLEALLQLLPQAQIFTLLHVPGTVSSFLEASKPKKSFIQSLPWAYQHYRRYIGLFPTAIEQFDLDKFDFVISTSHCASKSVVVPGRAHHLCYCFTPMRYAWDQFDEYFGPDRVGTIQNTLYRHAFNRLARWDVKTATRPNQYIAISDYIADRIHRYYKRESQVIYPPVDTEFYYPKSSRDKSYFLIVSALVPYKRIDLAIEACRLAKAPLRIAGDGPELDRLRKHSGKNVEFMGSCTDDEIRELYCHAKALLLPGEEDFGIAPVEAQACGTPVIAFGKGGATETVSDGNTGILVRESTAAAFSEAIQRVDEFNFDSTLIRKNSLRFSLARFHSEMRKKIEEILDSAKGFS